MQQQSGIKPGSRGGHDECGKDPVLEDWERVLRDTVLADKQTLWREAAVKFRYWLRETGRAPTVEAFRENLAWKKSYLPPARYEERLQALRWYWEKGE